MPGALAETKWCGAEFCARAAMVGFGGQPIGRLVVSQRCIGAACRCLGVLVLVLLLCVVALVAVVVVVGVVVVAVGWWCISAVLVPCEN